MHSICRNVAALSTMQAPLYMKRTGRKRGFSDGTLVGAALLWLMLLTRGARRAAT